MDLGLWTAPLAIFGACGLLGFFMRRSSKTDRRIREGRVTAVIGRKGHGKSLFATHEALRTLGRKQLCRKCTDEQGRKVSHPRRVAANFELRAANPRHQQFVHHVADFDDVYELPHMTLVILDELGIPFPASTGAKPLPAHVRHMLGQCRKYVLEFLWLAQREDRVTLGVRAQTDEMGIARKGMFRIMTLKYYEPEDVSNGRAKNGIKALWTYRYRVTRKLGRAFNTYEFIALTVDPDRAAARARLLGLDEEGEAGKRTKSATAKPPSTPAPRPVPVAVTTAAGTTYRHIA